MIIVYYLYYKARFKRRISHVPNLTRELNAYEVRRLNQLKLNATFAVSATETVEDSTFHSKVAFHMCQT